MITIKQATIDDIEDVIPLFDMYRVFYRKHSDLVAGRQFILDRLENNESIIYLAYEHGVAIGFTQLYPLFSSTRMSRVWLLNDLFVHADHRGKGISKLLIERAKQQTIETKAAALILETEVNNEIGNKLYPGVGFVHDVEHNHYYWEE